MPKWLLNTCDVKNGWYKADSSITQLFACSILACPIQQFISCFYVIPERYGFFEVKDITNKLRQNIVDLFNKDLLGNDELTPTMKEEKQTINATNPTDF